MEFFSIMGYVKQHTYFRQARDYTCFNDSLFAKQFEVWNSNSSGHEECVTPNIFIQT